MELLATTLILVGVFGLMFWYIRRVDRQVAARMSAEERERDRETNRRFMRGFWRAQAVLAAFVVTMSCVVVMVFVREGYWQVALVALPLLPLAVRGIVWSWRGGDTGDDE